MSMLFCVLAVVITLIACLTVWDWCEHLPTERSWRRQLAIRMARVKDASLMALAVLGVPLLFNLFLGWTLRDQLNTSQRLDTQVAQCMREWTNMVAQVNTTLTSVEKTNDRLGSDMTRLVETLDARDASLRHFMKTMLWATDDSAEHRAELLQRLEAVEAKR